MNDLREKELEMMELKCKMRGEYIELLFRIRNAMISLRVNGKGNLSVFKE